MLEPKNTVSEAFIVQFIVGDGVFEGTLLELATQLRASRIEPTCVPLLELARIVLNHYAALRETLRNDPDVLDIVSETFPHLAGVIELKTRMLLPRLPVITTNEDDELDEDSSLDDVLEGVEMLAKLEGAIAFLRERRQERSQMIVSGPHPIHLPRRTKPLSGSFVKLIEAARRSVREVNIFELSIDRLTMQMALGRLREFAQRVKRFVFSDVPTANWNEKTVLFSAMLESVRAGELEAEQPELYGEIKLKFVLESGLNL